MWVLEKLLLRNEIMQKIVINNCWGGFGLSDEAMRRYAELKGIKLIEEVNEYGDVNFYLNEINEDSYFTGWSIDRDDPSLVQVVEEMGKDSHSGYSVLKIVEIPDDVKWEIDDYDGREHIAEKHRKWS